jgi:hypothetical protein
MNFSRKTINILILTIIFNIITASLYFYVSGMVNKNLEKISNLSNNLNTQLLKQEQFKLFKNIINETNLDREELDTRFISSDGLVSFITQVEALATLSGVSVDIGNVSVSEYLHQGSKSELLEFLNMSISVSGSWENNFYFLNLLESLPYNISIDSFNLQTGGDTDNKITKWNGAFDLKTLKIK